MVASCCEKRPAGFFAVQVLEEMRDAGLARNLVGRTDPVPQHVGDNRRAVVGDDHDGKAVSELELRD